MAHHPAPLAILMSSQAQQAFGARVADVLAGRPHRLLDLDAAADADGTYPVELAFLSRDVTADSGKTVLAPTLERFYAILRRSPRLRWLQAHAAGADRPIYAEMRGRQVQVTTGSGTTAEPVAQMAFTGLLALARRLPTLMDAQRRGAWEPLLGARSPQDLKQQTALVVGLGPIGQEIARLLKAVRMRVVGVRHTPRPTEHVDQVVTYEDLPTVLPTAHWVLLACPLTALTRGLVDARALALLPPGAHLVNVARGEVVVEAALEAAIRSGHLGGAFLDVFEREPLEPAHPLWGLPNVLISPHTAAHTTGHYAAVGELFLDNLQRHCAGQGMRNLLP